MLSQPMNKTTDKITTDVSTLQEWAVPLTQIDEVENYPDYWALKGWRCVVTTR
jgi:hypothetical protein